ncbi:MAG: VOC family protein [Chloroflexi bacterium]|nr:VOC family protein [Chloroflexota bacterium]
MVIGFNHSGVVVKDIDMMVEFYRDALGLTVMREVDSVAPVEGNHTGIPGAHRTLVFVGKPEGEHVLELVHYIEPKSPEVHRADRNELGAAHICFDVEDLKTLHEELVERGIEFVTPPIWVETSAGLSGICYFRDPEGNYVELIQPPK